MANDRSGFVMPELPPKSWVGSSSPLLIKERKDKLQEYMRAITECDTLLRHGVTRDFLEWRADGFGGKPKTGLLAHFPPCRVCNDMLGSAKEQEEGLCDFCFKSEKLSKLQGAQSPT
mmetsp:Transcript_49953/g.108535  ORF Transcript_49953/g.108535 Transcript_49953/m.108535 type:complete len:117 (-) Transcript_49953:140-490(-)